MYDQPCNTNPPGVKNGNKPSRIMPFTGENSSGLFECKIFNAKGEHKKTISVKQLKKRLWNN